MANQFMGEMEVDMGEDLKNFSALVSRLESLYPELDLDQIVDYFENADAQHLITDRWRFTIHSAAEQALRELLRDFIDEPNEIVIRLLSHVGQVLCEGTIGDQPELQTTFQQVIAALERIYPELDLQYLLEDSEDKDKKTAASESSLLLPTGDTRSADEKLRALLYEIINIPNQIIISLLSDVGQVLHEGGIGYHPQIRAASQRLVSYFQKSYRELDIQPILAQPENWSVEKELGDCLKQLNLSKDLELWRLLRATRDTRHRFARPICAVELLSTARQVLRAGVIGYLGDIREAFHGLVSYLETNYPELDLQPILAEPENEAVKARLVDEIMRVTKGNRQKLSALPLRVDAFPLGQWTGFALKFSPYIPKKIKEPLEVLAAYGLDEILTAEDDPILWATAVVDAWPFPRDPQANLSEYYFQVAISLPDSDQFEHQEWRLSEAAGRVCANPWTEEEKRAEIIQRWGKPYLEPAMMTICVPRPSANLNTGWVNSGFVVLGGLGGSGHWDDWVRRPDGSWVPDKRGGYYIC